MNILRNLLKSEFTVDDILNRKMGQILLRDFLETKFNEDMLNPLAKDDKNFLTSLSQLLSSAPIPKKEI